MNLDLANSLFELASGFFVLGHCYNTYKNKSATGVSFISIIFFCSWGVFNLYLYPHVGLMLSYYGGIGVLIANLIWAGMVFYHRNNNKPKKIVWRNI